MDGYYVPKDRVYKEKYYRPLTLEDIVYCDPDDDCEDEEEEAFDSNWDSSISVLLRKDEAKERRRVSRCPRCEESSLIESCDPYCHSCGWDSLFDR